MASLLNCLCGSARTNLLDHLNNKIQEPNEAVKNMVLYNDLILDIIFSYMPLRDLKSLRLVCSKWNDLIYKFLETTAAVEFNMHNKHLAEQVLMEIQSDEKLPSSTVSVINPHLKKGTVFDKIINMYGDSITDLRIEPYKIGKSEYEYLSKIIHDHMPKLTSFSLGVPPKRNTMTSSSSIQNKGNLINQNTKLKSIACNIRSAPGNCGMMIDFLGNLIESSPELEEISGDNSNLFITLRKRLSPARISNLKSITFDNHEKSGDGILPLVALSKAGLQLEKFVWKDKSAIPKVNQLTEFLCMQKSFLKEFSLYLTQNHILNKNEAFYFSWLPQMEKLTCFKVFSTNPMFFCEKNWITFFPALKIFHYGTEKKNAVSALMNVIGLGICKPNLQLNSIQFFGPHASNDVALECVAGTLKVAFPNLKRFVYANNDWDSSEQHTKDFSNYLLPDINNCKRDTKECCGILETKSCFGEDLINYVNFMQ